MSIPSFARENSYQRDAHAREIVHGRSSGAALFSLGYAANSNVRIAFSTSSPSIGGLAKKFRYLSSTGRDYSLDVAVQQKFASDANAELDPLTNLVEEIIDHFRGRRLDSYPDAAWLKTEQTVLYAPEHLTEFRQFTSLLTFTYRVLR